MAKIIKLTNDLLEQCKTEFDGFLEKAREEFNSNLASGKCANGRVDFTFAKYVKEFESHERKATLHFSEIAWYKMDALIQSYSGEVGWHGIAYRDQDDTKDDYYITDIIVYPQMVDGTNVNTDQLKYERWLYALNDDQFNNLRMQGHSHVTFGCTPSITDENNQRGILSQLEGDMFYIFMIYNKYHARNIRIYDLKKNVLFDNSDVDVVISNDGLGLEDVLNSAADLVEKKQYCIPAVSNKVKPDEKKEEPVDTKATKTEKKKTEKKKESFKEFTSPKSAYKNYYYDEYDAYGYTDYDDVDDYYNRYGDMASDPFFSYDGYSNKFNTKK